MIYIDNNSTNPYFNLAFEEYFFNLEDDNDYVFLWQNEPTVVVGKNQNTLEEINSEYVKEKGIHVVRRITGGGAVYHDLGNLNYTIITKGMAHNTFDFKKFTMPIVKALKKLGIEAEQSGRNDITIDGKKFSGNAQFVKRNKVLHHGTLLFDSKMDELEKALKVSKDKYESKGVKSVRARVTNIKDYLKEDISILEFKDLLLKYMFDEDIELQKVELKPQQLEEINSLMKSKYLTWEWNYGKSPEFNMRQGKRFAGGKVEVLANIKDGFIREIKFYGDFFGSEGVEDIEEKLKGIRYEEGEIRKILEGLNIDNYFRNITLEEVMSCII